MITTKEEIHEFVKKNDQSMLKGIIDTLAEREDGAMVNIVGAAIFDYDLELLKRLYR